MGNPKFEDGTLLVGYRFHVELGNPINDPTRPGAGGTLVVDQMPVAGPIFYQALEAGGWAVCRGCRRTSGILKRSDAIRRWAHLHRCESGTRLDEYGQLPVDAPFR